jgi:hypothetical protein
LDVGTIITAAYHYYQKCELKEMDQGGILTLTS